MVKSAETRAGACARQPLTMLPNRVQKFSLAPRNASFSLHQGTEHKMALVRAPLLGFGASGAIANTQVYSTWKGRPYAREYVVPANPRSTDQTKTRDVFSWLNEVYKVAPVDFRTPWVASAKGRVMTDRNLFIQKDLTILRDLTALTGIILSPGAKGGLSAPVTLTGASGQITIAADAPDPLPAGWMVTGFTGVAIRQQDPHSGVLFDIASGTDDTAPYSVVLATLAAGVWMAGGWFTYQRTALATDLAYGPSTGATVTVG